MSKWVLSHFEQLAKVVESAKKHSMNVFITGDHGNAEQMVNPQTGEADPEHTKNPVPFIIANANLKVYNLIEDGILANISPTILQIMGITKPKEMSEQSLIVKIN